MILLPLLAGGATLVLGVAAYAAWLRTLPRSVCPRCRTATIAVRSGVPALDRWLRRRWCSSCAWTGWGRNGPLLWPERGPVSDGSGFRWGEDRMEPDLGFKWAQENPSPRAAAHPSGFRWRGVAAAARRRPGGAIRA